MQYKTRIYDQEAWLICCAIGMEKNILRMNNPLEIMHKVGAEIVAELQRKGILRR